MSFKEACDYLGCKLPTNFRRIAGYKLASHKPKPQWEPMKMTTPSDQWQSMARKYLEEAVYNLWAATGRRWLGWLKEIRGLNEATIKTYKLGLQPIDRWEKRESWGLEQVLKDNGKPKQLWLPEGLVIPYFIYDQISQLSFRRKKSAGGPRYFHLDGSHSHPMVLYPERDIVIVVESALDGFLLGQEAGDLAGVVILGSAQVQPDKELVTLLRRRRLILLALDADAAGARHHRWWLEQFPNSRRWPPIQAKDPGEMLQRGIDLRLWIEVGIARFLGEVAGPEEEKNELSSSGNDYSAEPQPQVPPSLDEATRGQESKARTLASESLWDVVI
jgi:DNA primase